MDGLDFLCYYLFILLRVGMCDDSSVCHREMTLV